MSPTGPARHTPTPHVEGAAPTPDSNVPARTARPHAPTPDTARHTPDPEGDTPGLRPPTTRRPRRASESGNALVLMPVAVLIVLGLGAMAVDAAVAFRARAELDALAAGLANDAAAAIAVHDWFDGQEPTPSTHLVDDLVQRRLAGLDTPLAPACDANIDERDATVTITCTGTATHVFHHVIGLDRTTDVHATATANLRTG